MSAYFVADVEPVSVLSLRDARPLQAGETTVARTLPFPPPPAAFWAAINRLLPARARGRQLIAHGFAVVVDADDGTEQELLPQPADLQIAKIASSHGSDEPQCRWEYLRFKSVEPAVVGELQRENESPLLPWGTPADELQPRGLLDPEQFRRYLLGEQASTPAVDVFSLHRSSLRVGVALDGRRARSGHLYTQEVQEVNRRRRPRFRLGLEIANSRSPSGIAPSAVVRLGGEARLAHVALRPCDLPWTSGFGDELREQVKQVVLEDSGNGPVRIRLCLLTPSVFSADLRALRRKGRTPAWRPFWLTSAKGFRPPFLKHARIRLVGALVDKPYPLGFWDSRPSFRDPTATASNWQADERREAGPGAPKPLYRCVPAGGVLFVELEPVNGAAKKEMIDEFFERLWFRTILLRSTEQPTPTWFGRQGFGTVVIGRWPSG